MVLLLTVFGVSGCGETGSLDTKRLGSPSSPFVEVASAAGLDFKHRNGATGEFYYPELMHGGCAFVDVDDDGLLDVYVVQAGPFKMGRGTSTNANRLYRNRGPDEEGVPQFVDLTAVSRTGDERYGTGVAAADYDADGDRDLYVTNYGRNTLLRNDGPSADGLPFFTDVTTEAGVEAPGYSSSAAFFDYDRDGDLDLYVVNYLDWSPSIERPCFGLAGLRGYCSPDVYERPQADVLYRNEGGGRFVDVSLSSGIGRVSATGLGITTADFDGDGWTDVYVANDQMSNQLWLNQGDGTFRDEALLRGCALNGVGAAEAGMGVTSEDFDRDGDWDLFVTHLSGESNTLYRNLGNGDFEDATDELGLGAPSLPYTGFGTAFFDYDRDGHFDLFVANGKVRMGDELEYDYAEPNLLFRGTEAGGFEEISRQSGAAFELVEVSRGAAFGDVDNDGDIDILFSNNDGPLRLLLNQTPGAGHWLGVRLEGARDRDAIGARVVVEAGGRVQERVVQPAHSYASSNDPRLFFGLGDVDRIERLTVTWPGGSRQEHSDLEVDRYVSFRQSSGAAGE